jgi:hypothetical protein
MKVESNGQGTIWCRERKDKIIVVVGGVESNSNKRVVLIRQHTHNYWEPESAKRYRIVFEGNNRQLPERLPVPVDRPKVSPTTHHTTVWSGTMSDDDSSRESDKELGNESSSLGEESYNNIPTEKESSILIQRPTTVSKGKRRRGNRGSRRKTTQPDALQRKELGTEDSKTDDNVINPSTSVAINKVATKALLKDNNDKTVDKKTPILIPRNAFPPDRSVTSEYVEKVLGDKADRLKKKQKFEEYVSEMIVLKENVLVYMKMLIKRKQLAIAKQDPFLSKTIEGLQIQWANVNVEEKVGLLRMCKSFWTLIQPGACDNFASNWEIAAEEEFMNRYNYQYIADDTQDKNKGCIAMTGNVTLRVARKALFSKATSGGHGYFLSPSAQSIRGSRNLGKAHRKRDDKFDWRYFRKSVSNIQGRVKETRIKRRYKAVVESLEEEEDSLEDRDDDAEEGDKRLDQHSSHSRSNGRASKEKVS